MTPFLNLSDIYTFQDLISLVKKQERTSPKVMSIMQPTKMDKEKIKKPEGLKQAAFATNKVKEEIAPPNYNKLKPLALGGGNEPTKPLCSL